MNKIDYVGKTILELLEVASQIDRLSGRFIEMSMTKDTINGVRAVTFLADGLNKIGLDMAKWSEIIRDCVSDESSRS